MVQVITSFKDLYGREPTATELTRMMEIKARLDKKHNRLMAPNKYNPTMADPAKLGRLGGKARGNAKQRKVTKPSKTGRIINRMLKSNMPLDKIAYILGEKPSFVEHQITRYRLPQEEVE